MGSGGGSRAATARADASLLEELHGESQGIRRDVGVGEGRVKSITDKGKVSHAEKLKGFGNVER
jgi:hypothetical protein